jgi:hypothetical protein
MAKMIQLMKKDCAVLIHFALHSKTMDQWWVLIVGMFRDIAY